VKMRLMFVDRALALLWAAFWIFFFVAEPLVYRTPWLRAAPWVGTGLVYLALALTPWRWARPGGMLLIVAGIVPCAAYAIWAPPRLPLASRVATIAVLGGPPLVSGMLSVRRGRRGAPAPDADGG
jgi:hypothetical protein